MQTSNPPSERGWGTVTIPSTSSHIGPDQHSPWFLERAIGMKIVVERAGVHIAQFAADLWNAPRAPASPALPPQVKRCAKLCAHQVTADFLGVRTDAQQVMRSPVCSAACRHRLPACRLHQASA